MKNKIGKMRLAKVVMVVSMTKAVFMPSMRTMKNSVL